MNEPYYRDEWVTIYCGDSKEVLPDLPKCDLVLTDPPYGVGVEYISYNDTRDNWVECLNFLIPWGLANSQMMIFPCCRIVELSYIYNKFPPDWLICWYKGSPGHCAFVGFNDWEPLLVYGKTRGTQMHDYFYCAPTSSANGHPCPKPIAWAKHLIAKTTNIGDLIIDPFMGIGTVPFAAKNLNRKCIGIEIEEKYCEIAANRCKQMVMELGI